MYLYRSYRSFWLLLFVKLEPETLFFHCPYIIKFTINNSDLTYLVSEGTYIAPSSDDVQKIVSAE